MRLPRFDYVEPKTLKQAVTLLCADPKRTVLLAGGTDLLVQMKLRLIQPQLVVNLKNLSKMANITVRKNGVTVGAMTSLRQIVLSPVIRQHFPALGQAAQEVGAYAHQVMGTLGGNLCQSNRCRYYHQSSFWRSVRPPCFKMGGQSCYVVPRENTRGPHSPLCHSTYCGDLAPVLIALDAQVCLTGPKGNRKIAARELYTQDGKRPLSLKEGEILREILLPFPSGTCQYIKVRRRDAIEFSLISLALRLDLGDDGRITYARIVLSGVGSGPVEAVETQKGLEGAFLDGAVIEEASRLITKEISPFRTSTASPAYQRRMAGILLEEALKKTAFRKS